MKKTLFLTIIFALACTLLNAQTEGVIISNNESDQPNPAAILELKSESQVFLPPRLTSEQRNNIENPPIGGLIYNTSRKCIEFYTGNQWTSASPAGTIHAYGGNVENIPNGWLLCDGTEVSANDYADLFYAIANNWGGSYPNFKLPDSRGLFLRGVNHQRSDTLADPNAENRIPNGAGNSNEVGSLQMDELKNHVHVQTVYHAIANGGNVPVGYAGVGGEVSGPYSTKPTGGNESRPKNAYVNFIIKY